MKMKKLVAFITVLALFISSITTSVSAKEITRSLEIDKNEGQVIFTSTPDRAFPWLLDVITQENILLNDNSIIQVLDLSNQYTHSSYQKEIGIESNDIAIQVTNSFGTTVIQDILLFAGDCSIDDQNSGISPMSSYTQDYTYNNLVVIHGTAVYTKIEVVESAISYSYYYQPIGVYFRYDKLKDCNVSYISVDYICDGYVYSYPGFTELGETINSIVVEQYNPRVSYMYSKTDQYPTDRVIRPERAYEDGHFFNFTFTINGSTYSDVINFTNVA